MPKFRRQFYINYLGSEGEINNEPSKTVPDMNMSVSDLLLNHSRGINSSVSHNEPNFFDTEIHHFEDITEDILHKQNLQIDLETAITEAETEAKIKADNQTLAEQAQLEKSLKDARELLASHPNTDEK